MRQSHIIVINISIISELNKEFPTIWLVERSLIWRYINRSRRFYNIFEALLLSLPPLQSRQVNMADSCEWIFRLFGRHHCRSRIFERMENIKNDCCRLWTKKPFKNLRSRQLRKNRKRSGFVDCQQVRSIDRNLFFPKLKLLILRQWWQLWMKSTEMKQRYRIIFFLMFRLSVLLLNSMSKLIHNQCTCKHIVKTLRLHTYLCANEQLRLCFMF